VDPERKEKLRAALVRKLLSKYHPGISNSKTERLVHSEVERLMAMDRVTEDVLHEVEARVRKQSNDEIAFIVTNPFKNVTSHKSGAQDEWAAMNEMVVRAGLDADTRKNAQRLSQKQAFKRQLDEQITEAEARKRAEKMEKELESSKVLKDVKAYVTAMDRKKQEQYLIFDKIRKEREREMEQTRTRNEANLRAKREEEEREIAKVKKMQQDEYEKLMKKRQDDGEKMRRWKLENERNLAEKERLRQLQYKEDLEFSRKADAALDEKEQRRLDELRIVSEKMKARERHGEALGASQAAQAAEDEARMVKIQAEARQKAEAQFLEKARREHQKKIEVRATLDKQVEEQERRKKEERETALKQSTLFKEQAQTALEEEQRKMQAKRDAREEYRMQLEDQLRHDVKLRPTRELMMSEVERKINKSFRPR